MREPKTIDVLLLILLGQSPQLEQFSQLECEIPLKSVIPLIQL